MTEATHHMPIPMQLKWKNWETGELDETGKLQRGTYIFHAGIQQMFKRSSPERLFSSGIQQRLVMNRVSRFAGVCTLAQSVVACDLWVSF